MTSRHIADALVAIEFPADTSWLSEVASSAADLWYRRAIVEYHKTSVSGEILRRVKYLAGRIYHWLTTCPRVLRRLLTIGGERLAEADLGSSYFTLLAGHMPAGRERDRLISLLQAGGWYSWLQSFNVVDGGDLATVKIEAQRQLLFGRDWRVESRPLWGCMISEFPTLGQVIERNRKTHKGPSGFAHWLSREEGRVMRPALASLHDCGVLALPLHDGNLVGEQSVEQAADAIRESARKVLAFEPLVKIK